MTDSLESPADTPAQIEAMLKHASELRNAGEGARAEALLESIVAEHPHNAVALQAFGRLRSLQARLPEAEQFYRRAIAAAPDSVHGHNDLATVLYALTRYAEAVDAFREVIRLKPN